MIINYKEISGDYNYNLGGKILNLNKIKEKFNIPKGFIITDIGDLEKYNIYDYYKKYISSKFYICRSSMSLEDSQKLSYAGFFNSIEGKIEDKELVNDIIQVFYSLDNKFIFDYEKQIIGNEIISKKMNVLIQEFIFGEVSGVYLSKYKDNTKIIEYIKGSNQLLVNGTVKSNKIIFDINYNIIIHEKKEQYKYIGNKMDIFYYNKINKSLTDSHLNLLLKELKKLEKIFDFDIDVEWTISKGVVYILQVRPITIK